MNILFITYHDFSSNSSIQIHNFANTLVKMGNECCIAVPKNKECVNSCIGGEILYKPLNYSDLSQQQLFSNGRGPDIIHAWTPREGVRKQSLICQRKFKCKLIIHLEDNEELLLENALSISIENLRSSPLERLDKIIPDSLSHPIFYQDFLRLADGITVIMDTLIEFIPCNKNYLVLWPGLDRNRFVHAHDKKKMRSELGIKSNEVVICYTGNVHHSNAKEVRSLYLAVALLNREGIPTRLIRTGIDFVPFLGDNSNWAHKFSIEKGFISHQQIAENLDIADILIQPGKRDRFNKYRLPSKLPEFFFMQKPVVLPNINVGRFIKNYQEGLLLEKGDAIDIVECFRKIIDNPDLAETISKGGKNFALRMFDLEKNTKTLEDFYKMILYNNPISEASFVRFSNLQKKYMNYRTFKTLGYSTVGDYIDSTENFPEICGSNGDLKNVQRPWIIKAIVATVPYGGKLIEIGAGEPKVANILNNLGYKLTIIDPYEGGGNGPTEYECFNRQYPDLEIIKDHFENYSEVLRDGSYDCIYSISVLEHVPSEKLSIIFDEINRILKPNGCSIHCIDHVLMGNGAQHHEENLKKILLLNNLLPLYDEMISSLKEDLETFYLSAEGHNLWRGNKKYEDFPFRKVVSINLLKRSG